MFTNLTVEHNDDVDRAIIPGAVQEPLNSTETCHDPENVTGTASSRGVSVGNVVHTVASEVSERMSIENTSVVRTTPQYGLEKCVKRIRIPEQDVATPLLQVV